MENWLIGLKFIILLYCGVKFALGDIKNLGFAILTVLVYISLSMLYYLFPSVWPKRIFSVACMAAVVFMTQYVDPLFIFLAPVTTFEFVSSFRQNRAVEAAIIVLSAFLCTEEVLVEYLLFASFSFLFISLALQTKSSLSSLIRENEKLQDRNDYLNSRLSIGEEYETQVKYLSQLEERNNLAQEIHDKVGHTIAGSLIQLEAASLIIRQDAEKAKTMVDKAINHLKEGMESIRSALRSIKPPAEQLGINRLKKMLDEFTLQSMINTEFAFSGKLEVISHSQWSVIADNLGEALTNAMKHSGASKVRVELNVLNKLIKVEIKDNGKGAAIQKRGLGISGMEERTDKIGGKLVVDGSNGFSVIMLLPVEGI